ncbi:hypothetical protein V2W30_41305 (plasmid) [Streptomyces sp. Q6]|uniref:Uncharacterized protein n=1 Tax=Streptomyces citrinus TaxID=3118173 RepID=A0ACD5AQZ9_9ACTN
MSETNPTALLLALAARAQDTYVTAELKQLLRRAHNAWCAGIAQVRTEVHQQCQSLDDEALRARCAAADVPWEPGTARSEALGNLAFELWNNSPAAIAYTELEARASHFGVSLVAETIE